MSIESARMFVDRMKSDANFAQKVKACSDIDECRACVEAEGFNFTLEEVMAVVGTGIF